MDVLLFSSGNAKDFDFNNMIKNIEKDQEESKELEELRNKSKEEINKNHDLEIEDMDDDSDLVNAGMDLKYDLLTKENEGESEEKNEDEDDKEFNKLINDIGLDDTPTKSRKDGNKESDDDFFNKFVDNILGDSDEKKDKDTDNKKDRTSLGNLANIRLGRRRRNRRSEEALDSKDVNDFLDEIAKMEKSEEVMADENLPDKEDHPKNTQKRDIYIQQKDQYFVDDEEVYLNELETDHCNWTNIKNLFKVITEADNEIIRNEDENRETVLNYFHDICKGLMNSRSEDFLSFVYSSPCVMDGLIKYGAHEGVQKVLDSVLNLYESVNNLNSFRFLKHRFGLYRRLLRKIIECTEDEKVNQLTKIFVQLVKEKSNIIDANYFIDKILLDNENHVAILDKVVKESNVLLTELSSLIVKRVVPEEDRGFLEENSVREINKNFGGEWKDFINNIDQLGIEFAIDENSEESGKSEDNEDKKLSNQTTAEASANITFDVYDPVTLKKNHFTRFMIPRITDLKTALFGEIQESARIRLAEQAKALKSISEFNESQKEEEEDIFQKIKMNKDLKPNYQEMKTFVVNKDTEKEGGTQQKQFVIDFEDLGGNDSGQEDYEEVPTETVNINITEEIENRAKKDSMNPFIEDKGDNKFEISEESNESNNLYEMINSAYKYRMSEKTSSSGYSKENLVLDMTPDKPKRSSIDFLHSSDKKQVLSDFKNQKLNPINLNYSINSRPSFLDKKPHKNQLSKDYDKNWDCLSVNTNDLINSEGVSVLSDNEKQGILEEIMDLDMSHEDKVLMVELLREKDYQEAQVMLNVLKKMPWIFKETLKKRKKELIKRKKERKEKRLRHRGSEVAYNKVYSKGNQLTVASPRFAIQLISLLDNLWTLKLQNLNWEILSDNFTVKAFSLFKEYGKNNLLHIKLASLLKNILSFLLKESESYQGTVTSQNDNMLPQMSNFSPPNNEISSRIDTARKCSRILNDTFEYLNKELVMFWKKLSKKEKNQNLFKGFIIQLCRIILSFEKRGHQVVKDNSNWKLIYYDFLFHEVKKEDRVLVEDPKNKVNEFDDNMRLPVNFKFNNASLQGKMNLQSNYDSLGNQGMILDDDDEEDESPKQNVLKDLDEHHKNSDSDSDSDSDNDEDLLKNYSFGKSGGLLLPKKISREDNDYSGYDSGVGKGVDFTNDNLEDTSSFKKSQNQDFYDIVNDWNIYGQGSWKALGEDLSKVASTKKYGSVKKKDDVIINQDNEDQRHQISRKDNKKYGLYGSLTRRFQIRNKTQSNKEMKVNMESFYNSGNALGKSTVQVDR